MEHFYTGKVYRGASFTPHREFDVYREGDALHWGLTKNQTTLVDVEEFDYINKVTWSAVKATNYVGWYVTGGGKNKQSGFKMHRYMAGIHRQSVAFEVDHINRNPLDNRKVNLRLATRQQQQLNLTRLRFEDSESGGYAGVRLNRNKTRYQAWFNGQDKKWKSCGCYSCPVEAAKARDEAVYESFKNHNPLFGLESRGIIGACSLDFLYFNFPERMGLTKRDGV